MTIGDFLDSAEYIDAPVIVYDSADRIVFEDAEGYSVNDPSCKLPSDVANFPLVFWVLEDGIVKIYG